MNYPSRSSKMSQRSQRGGALEDFAPTFMLFILCLVVPVGACLGFSANYCIKDKAIVSKAEKLAHSDKVSKILNQLLTAHKS
ncbi:MAG: hypothetical protein K2X77_28345 [Candidatus Obscuribacterales bacterium]|nr:hypothetical protein [Candidatus Obscuribacterales bacterium]